MATKVIDNRNNHKSKPKLGQDIPTGTVFTGFIDSHPNRLFKRIYERVVALDDDSGDGVWTLDVPIDDYRPVDITITIRAD